MKSVRYLLCLALLFSATTAFAQTGKIAGKVVDARTGEALVGANVMIDGTQFGAASDVEGFFTILSVSPGTYRIRASIVGYTPSTQTDVKVNINQTTNLEFKLNEQAIQAQEVVITATRPIVERDVAASRANITAKEVENLPVSQVSSIIGLEAGVQGLTIRGGDASQTAFMADGLTMRDERNNQPYTAISLLAVQEFQIQTGGFSAEYGNIRSGVINVVTKEGNTKKYTVGLQTRVSPPTKKYFGIAPNDPNSYWVRPFLDDAVAWTGTNNGKWDPWMQEQYAVFGGWNKISQSLLSDTDPTNDLTPAAAQEVWKWQHRKSFNVTKPDYDIDFGLGGPVPGGEYLGNLRFYASFRSQNNQFAVPLSRDGYSDYSTTLKVTSDISKTMKLMVEATVGRNESVDINQTGVYGSFGSAASEGSVMNSVSYIDTRLFTTDYWAPNSVNRQIIGAKFTHVISPTTFYEVLAQRFASQYSTNPGRTRDTSRVYKFGNSYMLDEAPFGFFPTPGVTSLTGIEGMRMGVGMSNARDSSKLATYTMKFDLTSQLDRYNEFKGGFEFAYTDNGVNYGSVDMVLATGRSLSSWHTFPIRMEVYVKDKLEFEGMIIDMGVRVAMSHAGGEWFVYDPYTNFLTGPRSFGIDTLLQMEPTKYVTNVMPRLNVAFPITDNAKLYFNYGHFRAMPTPENLYLIRHETATSNIIRLADPNLPLEKTVAYELGFENNIMDMFLLRIAAYYKDISNERYLVEYIGYNNTPDYTVSTPNLYEDVRGFEITLRKNRGNWIQGFVNYTYMVSTSGHFGWGVNYQNAVDQRNYQRNNPIQSKPIPQPYARANIDLFTPENFGPKFGGINPLADWRLSILGSYSAGFYFTYVGGGSFPGVSNNLQWKDQYGLDIRLSKTFNLFDRVNLMLFMDVSNVLNLKQLTTYGDVDGTDFDRYLKSLHLPEEMNQFYGQIPGSDRAGDYRAEGVAYQPMVYTKNLTEVGTQDRYTSPIYYEFSSRSYYRWVNNTWQPANQSEVDQVLKDKAYIHMPTQDWWNFLNPRDFYFGLRMSFDVF
ncbi:MAG: carboxypeptidase-like regulatory domain-containing protein [Ignavibacteriales bacterium]|nr:carboxypeptidase-like regulatory domain-containing protein [Ignavibacteriales bacterium]